jgi:signal peptidase I
MRWAVAVGLMTSVLPWFRRHYAAVTVRGLSMRPTLHDGDRVLVRRVLPARLRVGDLVVARPGPLGGSGDRWLVKRVAALPGDPIPKSVSGRVDRTTVPAGALILLGDNAAVSWDSRTLGFFDAGLLLGRVERTLPRSPVSRADGLLYGPEITSDRAGIHPGLERRGRGCSPN